MKKIALFLSVAMLFMSMSTTAFATSTVLQTLTFSDDDGDGLYVGKLVAVDDAGTANDNTDDVYTVTVESFTTGETQINETATNLDIVLVIDDSSEGVSGGKEALQTAVNNFIDTMKTEADGYPTDTVRIAAVTFASNTTTYSFKDVNSWTKSSGNYISLSKSGYTRIDDGMTAAQTLVNSIDDERDSEVIVVVFMDGVPNEDNYTAINVDAALDVTMANNAIATAYELKQAGATIYTVGQFTGCNTSQINNGSESVGSSWQGWRKAEDCCAIVLNRFLNFLSSNYENASTLGVSYSYVNDEWSKPSGASITSWYDYYKYTVTTSYGGDSSGSTSKGYYLAASAAGDLGALFTTITDSISIPDIELDSKTVVQEVVSTSFTLENDASNIKVYTATCTSYNDDPNLMTWGESTLLTTAIATVDTNTNTVKVSGFDYAANFVESTQKSDGTYGQKLIVEYTVTLSGDTIGGDNISINGDDSGIYAYDEDGVYGLIDSIPSATANVALTYSFSVNNYSIYLGNSISVSDILGAAVTALNGTNNAYASVSYQVVDASGATVYEQTVAAGIAGTTLSDTLVPTADTTYTVKCTVSSGSMDDYILDEQAFSIDVLYPTVTTIEDIAVPLGAYVDLVSGDEYDAAGTETYESTVTGTAYAWDTSSYTLNGEEPSVTLGFTDASGATYTSTTPPSYEANADNTFTITGFTTTGTAGTNDQIDYVTFANNDDEFDIDIMRYNLTIKKTLTGEYDESYLQDFVFDVTDGDDNVITTVVFDSNGGEITIKDLYVGQDITVTEDSDWSWRYLCVKASESVSTDRNDNDTTITISFANSLTNTNWLSISSMFTNVFASARS